MTLPNKSMRLLTTHKHGARAREALAALRKAGKAVIVSDLYAMVSTLFPIVVLS
jgi:hypothetical protein